MERNLDPYQGVSRPWHLDGSSRDHFRDVEFLCYSISNPSCAVESDSDGFHNGSLKYLPDNSSSRSIHLTHQRPSKT